ncbi:MAG: hypothetical protein ACJAQT_000705 [Akkermansiaceae bacterium]|jgi:hypothetical protein
MNLRLFGLLISPIFVQLALADSWTAYNDSVDTDPGSTPVNATNFGLGRSYLGDGSSGNLIDFESGADTGVMVEFTENFSAGNSINWAQDFAEYTPGTDAAEIFGGKLDLTGNMSYNDEPGWSMDLTLSNLDPNVAYTFVATAHRNGGSDYATRVTNWTLIGADSANYASSTGAHKISETSAEFSTGDNVDGLVARWTNIRAGADGTFSIQTTHGIGGAKGGITGADDYRGYAGGLFMLMPQIQDAPVITSIAYDDDLKSAMITWPTRSGQTYAIDASDDLVNWNQLEGDPVIDGDTTSFTETEIEAPGSRRFYRVRNL